MVISSLTFKLRIEVERITHLSILLCEEIHKTKPTMRSCPNHFLWQANRLQLSKGAEGRDNEGEKKRERENVFEIKTILVSHTLTDPFQNSKICIANSYSTHPSHCGLKWKNKRQKARISSK